MLETRNLTKIYNENVLAVNELNLKVDDGEIYVVLGANGAGKSTTISMLAELHRTHKRHRIDRRY